MDNKLTDLITDFKPHVKEKTIKMYVNNIRKLFKMIHGDDEFESLNFLNNIKKVGDTLEGLHFTTRRNYFNAIIVSLQSAKEKEELLDKYIELRDELNKQYDDEQATGVVSDKQKDNLINIEEIYKMLHDIAGEIRDKKIKKKEELLQKDHLLIMTYFLINLYVRYPFRNDVAGMEAITKRAYNKLSDPDKKDNNFLVIEKNKMFFVLNEYKTSKKYKEKTIEIEDNEFKKLIRMYIRINGMGVLFKSSTGKALSRNGISQLLLKTFKKRLGKNISTTLLRKIYLSSKYSDMKEEMIKDSFVMGHSMDTALKVYVKKPQEEEVDDPS